MTDLEVDLITQNDFDLSRFPGKQQFEYYADEFCKLVTPVEVSLISPRSDFPMLLSAVGDGVRTCAVIKGISHKMKRTKSLINKSPSEALWLSMIIQGRGVNVECANKRVQSGPNRLILYNADVPNSSEGLDDQLNTAVTLNLTGLNLHEFNCPHEEIFGDDINQNRYAPLLRQTLKRLALSVIRRNDTQTNIFFPIAHSLAQLIVRDTYGHTDLLPEHVFRLIQIEILREYTKPGLQIDHIAEKLNMKPLQIEEILYAQGVAFEELVQDYRLAAVLGKVSDPQWSDKTMEEIALTSGFASIDEFCEAMSASRRNLLETSSSDPRKNTNSIN